jgi:hypothetical protein
VRHAGDLPAQRRPDATAGPPRARVLSTVQPTVPTYPNSVRKLGAAPGPLTFRVMRAYLVWLFCLVPGLYEVIQCTLSLSCDAPWRAQTSGMPGAVVYSSTAHVLRDTLAKQGVWGLYAGIMPNFLKVLPATSISYAVLRPTRPEQYDHVGKPHGKRFGEPCHRSRRHRMFYDKVIGLDVL